ncbi:TatD family deoxyribonuclease [Clostridium botulinum]|uniref:TatD family hydrolase n=1 Tax=Clostridium botulinum TaxID=1491 RepID=UPI0004D7D306|nr:TatD family hydrolase [Clostridium botulinum]KEI06803.1 hydrolase TatD [Clostridium botulinum C/D str. BKT75002]KEI10913.1 hydrolase TatD [Clostridium botulinum C/D str. BKT2873]KGM94737.1 hydrolase TatD [Clostridium botulinum D str. CCUG 7971]KOC45969.1 hydrolase TatD [Clostridium botulinum]MCD3351815.1 TatD family hydrolase [Clostridium botulinum D/C]
MIFDSHAHYDDESFNEDREEIIKQIKENGVRNVLNCGASMEGARDSLKLADKYDFFYAAVGIHPENAYELTEENYEEIKNMTKHPKVRAIGEIGLDYYWEENPPREKQKEVFRKQMSLARELNMPVIIHDRDAHKDTLDIMKEFPGVKGVVHCFSGSVEFARECLKLGYYIGFTGVITFKNAKKTIEVAKEVPMDKILVETDAPYMAPTPNRGKRNRSDYIEFIIDKIAEIKEISKEEVSQKTIENAKNLLKIKY